MNKQTFIVSDESVNTHGFVILTSGIDYANFARNPIMLYMHNEHNGVIGRWENIRVDGDKLLMDAVFDDSTELGKRVKTQVENNFLRCASIGVADAVIEERNGVKTAVKCRLREVSIVDIPANGNAIRLYDKQGRQVYNLADWVGIEGDPLRKTIKAYLGLSDSADDSEIVKALDMRSNRLKTPENVVSRAVRLKLIDESDREDYMRMACADIEAFDELIARKEQRAKATFENVFLQAARDGRVDARCRAVYEEIAETGGYALCERVLSLIPRPTSVTALIEHNGDNSGGIPPRSAWGLSEYRKYAPEELQNNNELYISLMEREGQHIPLTVRTLDYYRKHNPDYLAQHPKEYERVMNERRELKDLTIVKH